MENRVQTELTRRFRLAVLAVLHRRYPEPLSESLILEGLRDRPELSPDRRALLMTLPYLEDAGLIRTWQRNEWLAVIAPNGIDELESSDTDRAAQNRRLRMRVLQALSWNNFRPLPESAIPDVLAEDADLDLSLPAVHAALAYLCDRGLAAWDGKGIAKIRAPGQDYLEHQGPEIAGVARPVTL